MRGTIKVLVEIDHQIACRYANPVAISSQLIHLCPSIPVLNYSLDVLPGVPIQWMVAYRDNRYAVVAPIEKTDRFDVRSRFSVDVDDSPPPIGASALMDVCRGVHDKVQYVTRDTGGVQEPAETLRKKTGTCRDFAWLLADTLRHMKFQARFVSGYYVHLDSMTAELHAWTEVKHNDRWIGLDPTLCEPVGKRHIPVASARHHRNAMPVSGTISPPTEIELTWSIACRPCAVTV